MDPSHISHGSEMDYPSSAMVRKWTTISSAHRKWHSENGAQFENGQSSLQQRLENEVQHAENGTTRPTQLNTTQRANRVTAGEPGK